MSYYTSFSLNVTPDGNALNTIPEEDGNKINETIEKCLPFLNGDYEDGWFALAKWYEYDFDMEELSKMFPKYVFTLYGDGEEFGDNWVKYFVNGLVAEEQATILYEKFDESRLHSVTPNAMIEMNRVSLKDKLEGKVDA